MKKAVVIGSGSGIGAALVRRLCLEGWQVGAAGRQTEVLRRLKQELGGKIEIQELDLRSPESAMNAAGTLIEKMGGCDLFIFNSGILPVNPDFDWAPEIEGTRVNVIGFQAMCQAACHFFEKQGHGHLAGISSIASLRGSGRCPAYNASKAFMANYMEGLRQRYYKTNIHITDIRPGFVRTQMIEGRVGIFLDVSADTAADRILRAVEKKKKVAYVPKRWWWFAQAWKLIPEWLYHTVYQKHISRPDYRDFPEIREKSESFQPK